MLQVVNDDPRYLSCSERIEELKSRLFDSLILDEKAEFLVLIDEQHPKKEILRLGTRNYEQLGNLFNPGGLYRDIAFDLAAGMGQCRQLCLSLPVLSTLTSLVTLRRPSGGYRSPGGVCL